MVLCRYENAGNDENVNAGINRLRGIMPEIIEMLFNRHHQMNKATHEISLIMGNEDNRVEEAYWRMKTRSGGEGDIAAIKLVALAAVTSSRHLT